MGGFVTVVQCQRFKGDPFLTHRGNPGDIFHHIAQVRGAAKSLAMVGNLCVREADDIVFISALIEIRWTLGTVSARLSHHLPQSHYATTILTNVSLTPHSILRASPSPPGATTGVAQRDTAANRDLTFPVIKERKYQEMGLVQHQGCDEICGF